MKKLIEQLRDIAGCTNSSKVYSACTAAADTIEDLQAKLEKAVCMRAKSEKERDELRKKLDRIPEVEPDKWDLEMILQVTRAERDVTQAKLALIKNVLEL